MKSTRTNEQADKIGHLTISKLALKLGHTVQALRQHLMTLGILAQDGKPSSDAIDAGLVKPIVCEDFRDRTKESTFFVYDADHLMPRIPKGDVAKRMAKIRSMSQVTGRIEDILHYALKALKAPSDLPKQRIWARQAGFDETLISHLEELEFQDMHFLGDPFIFEMLDKPAQVAPIKERIQPLQKALHKLLVASNLMEQAGVFQGAMDLVFSNVQSKLEKMQAKASHASSEATSQGSSSKRMQP